MRYPVVVHHEDGTAYGVTVPDIPGCFSAGDSFEEALDKAVEAITGHLEILAEDGEAVPLPGDLSEHQANADYDGGIWGFVEVDITPFLGKGEKINVTLPSLVLHKIASAGIKNRSAFLAEAALKELG